MENTKKRLPDLLERVAAVLASWPLAGTTLAVGFSGGRDSMALLDMLRQLSPRLGFSLQAIHVNHGLNPHAGEWQQFCEHYCQHYAIPLRVHALHLVLTAGESVEALARAGRYAAFAQSSAHYLALAHHRDDQAETFLLQALRGAGPFGLAAMPLARPLGNMTLLRPLLGMARQEVEAWLLAQQLSWVDDDSNDDPRYRRNAIRHQVLPALECIDASAKQGLARAASHCGETVTLLLDLARVDATPDAAQLPVSALRGLTPARARNVLRAWLWLHGWPLPRAAQLQMLLDQSLAAAHDRQPALLLAHGAVRRFAGALWWAPLWQPSALVWQWNGERRFTLPGWAGEFRVEKGAEGVDEAWLRAATFTVRPREGGESVLLSNRRPRQSLKNLFQQAAIAPWERVRWPLFWLDNELVMVPNIGIAPQRQVENGVCLRWQPATGVAVSLEGAGDNCRCERV